MTNRQKGGLKMKMRAKNVQCPGLVPGRGRPMLGPAIAADKLRRCLALAAARGDDLGPVSRY